MHGKASVARGENEPLLIIRKARLVASRTEETRQFLSLANWVLHYREKRRLSGFPLNEKDNMVPPFAKTRGKQAVDFHEWSMNLMHCVNKP